MQRSLKGGSRSPGQTCALSDLSDLNTLPEDVREALKAICRQKSYEAGQTIAEADRPSDFIGIVRDGILRMEKTLSDGRRHLVGLLVEGDIFGHVFDGEMHFNVEAATSVELFTFRRGPFEEILLRSPDLDRLLLLNLLNELDRARDWMIILANPKVRGRLAGFLLLLCTRFQNVDHVTSIAGDAIRLRIPLSRRDLANLLGTRLESVSRAFHALANDGLIDILQPRVVEIRDLEALADEAGGSELGDPASLHQLMLAIQKPTD
ncbi:Crp/Fnr family transcriptional regulator [Mameliella sp. AT18]|uniref:Crp/Fnr family transcriptional regulator n=1 Tax=Mameliella sp. AT18 TaxID=3028385 RepID=UPI00237A272F|nr:Crp/Fnr family transcriptional regulator [Mameliella sp. AT18]MDD9731291.1 Crp/Fnr family transcriptional regulator [Mameliella sp. AT18]